MCDLGLSSSLEASVLGFEGLEVEGNSPNEPEKTLCGGVGLGLELIADEVLEGLGLEGGSQLPLPYFLYEHKISKLQRRS